jgi:hypothetical protein
MALALPTLANLQNRSINAFAIARKQDTRKSAGATRPMLGRRSYVTFDGLFIRN